MSFPYIYYEIDENEQEMIEMQVLAHPQNEQGEFCALSFLSIYVNDIVLKAFVLTSCIIKYDFHDNYTSCR